MNQITILILIALHCFSCSSGSSINIDADDDVSTPSSSLTRQEMLLDSDFDGTFDSREIYTFDNFTLPIKIEEDRDNDGEIEYTHELSIDTNHLVVTSEKITDSDGTQTISYHQWSYDSSNRIIKQETTDSENNTTEIVEYAYWSGGYNNMFIITETKYDSQGNETPISFSYCSQDSLSNNFLFGLFHLGCGTSYVIIRESDTIKIYTIQNDSKGNPTVFHGEEVDSDATTITELKEALDDWLDEGNIVGSSNEYFYTYDARNEILTRWMDENDDGQPDSLRVVTNTYADGTIYSPTDSDKDGIPDEMETYLNNTTNSSVEEAASDTQTATDTQTVPDIQPTADEVCDGTDNDGDGQTDEEGGTTTYYADTDADGHGDLNSPLTGPCNMPANFVTNSDDCNDDDNTIYPGNTDSRIYPDGKDNDCDGFTDEGNISAHF